MKEARPDAADKRNRKITLNTAIYPLGIDSYFISERRRKIEDIPCQNNRIGNAFINLGNNSIKAKCCFVYKKFHFIIGKPERARKLNWKRHIKSEKSNIINIKSQQFVIRLKHEIKSPKYACIFESNWKKIKIFIIIILQCHWFLNNCPQSVSQSVSLTNMRIWYCLIISISNRELAASSWCI